MQKQQVIGIILIAAVIFLYFLWLRFQRKQQSAVASHGIQEATVLVRGAYNPNEISLQQGIPTRLYFNRQEDVDCSRFVTIDTLGIRKNLKPFAVTVLSFTPREKGIFTFSCDMGMYQGKIVVA